MHASLDEKSMQEQIARKHVMFICSRDWLELSRAPFKELPAGNLCAEARYSHSRCNSPSLASEGVSRLK